MLSVPASIRAYRLSKSAVALRLTARPILDIAPQHRFGHSKPSPAPLKAVLVNASVLYRRLAGLELAGMRPPLRLGEFAMLAI